MRCSYDVTTNNPDGSFTNRMCLDEAKVDGLCFKCAYNQLQAENKELKERIAFAVDYLPECPDQAKAFLTPALKKGG